MSAAPIELPISSMLRYYPEQGNDDHFTATITHKGVFQIKPLRAQFPSVEEWLVQLPNQPTMDVIHVSTKDTQVKKVVDNDALSTTSATTVTTVTSMTLSETLSATSSATSEKKEKLAKEKEAKDVERAQKKLAKEQEIAAKKEEKERLKREKAAKKVLNIPVAGAPRVLNWATHIYVLIKACHPMFLKDDNVIDAYNAFVQRLTHYSTEIFTMIPYGPSRYHVGVIVEREVKTFTGEEKFSFGYGTSIRSINRTTSQKLNEIEADILTHYLPLYNLVSMKLVPWANQKYFQMRNTPLIARYKKHIQKIEIQMAKSTRMYEQTIQNCKQKIASSFEQIAKYEDEIKMTSQ